MCPHSAPTLTATLAVVACMVFDGAAGVAARQSAACDAGLARLVATVQDRATRVPLADVVVTASWRMHGEQSLRLLTDSAGTVTVCAPPDSTITLRAAYPDVRVQPQTTILTLSGTTRHLLAVEAPGAFIRGRVLDEGTGAPIAGAAVAIVNTPLAVIAAMDGSFQLERLPAGEYTVRVAHISYMTAYVPLRVGTDDLNAAIRLAPTAIALEPVLVTPFSRRLDRAGFYERQNRGLGTFISRRQIEAMKPLSSADLLRNVPGVRLVPQTPGRNVSRTDLQGRGTCRFSFIVDGARTLPDFQIDFVAPGAIEGIEVYRSVAEVPALFRPHVQRDGTSTSCGVIAIWTRDSR